jgi:CO/xanthine dehydrogenase FAD-binding subunit
MKRFDYYQPESLKEAYGLVEKLGDGARYIAGGTDIIWRIKKKVIATDALISLRGIGALKGIKDNGVVSLGSMTVFRDIERDPLIAREFPSLAKAVSVLANPQIRNVATLGGNLCNAAPSADTAPPLMVLEAKLEMEGPGGKHEVSIDAFFTGPGQTVLGKTEIMTGINVPKTTPGTSTAFIKMGRLKQDIAVVNGAALVVMDKRICRKCRLAIGAVAPIPLRLKEVEKMLEGREIETQLLDQVEKMVQQEVKPISDVRSVEEYRRAASGILVRRAIEEAVAKAA